MKLKLFGRKEAAAEKPAETPQASAPETPETPEAVADDSAAVVETPEAEAVQDVPESGATQEELITQMNACTEAVEALQNENAEMRGRLEVLEGDRSEEIAQAASDQAVAVTASQGVPVAEVPDANDQASLDEPKSRQEFLDAYHGIEDPEAAGAYHAKWGNKFGQK